MESIKCKICGGLVQEIFKKRILKKYDVTYYQCKECAFLFTEDAYWLNEAYNDAISVIDTGVMQRNVQMVHSVNVLLKTIFKSDDIEKNYYLDYGGGYGIFTRMMRDLGYQWLWTDKYAENLVAKGFEHKEETISLITAFEVFEHFTSPKEEIKKMLKVSQTIVFSTLLYDDDFDYKKNGNWWYYTPDSGQHVSFYSKRTLEKIAKANHLNYYKINDNFHIFTNKNIKKADLVKYKFFQRYFMELFYKRQAKHSLASADMKTMMERINSIK